MNGSGPRRAQRLLRDSLSYPATERDDFFVRACGDDADLLAEVRSLYAKWSSDDPITLPTAGGEATPPGGVPIEGPGTRIGPYTLIENLGEGGFGVVYLAQQDEPVRRRVALKIIKLGMDTRQVVARFEQERQALAMMDHPHIAKVLDAGATDAGRPYFVMELVKGDPIVEYCDKNNLSIEERLGLFGQVCDAVQHAHTKGIIHRDIKPSNVLVSTQGGAPQIKVIDFGIAKATAARLTEKTLFTEHRALIGTPEYMSPEQAEGSLDIDTRTDVYSLGVMLYELLTGTTPFTSQELRSAAYAEIQRIIRQIDPPRPSTRISQNTEGIASIAAHRHTQPRRLGTIVRGELDWIVMKALEKDRRRRYETANGLGMDIRRYLAGEAVVAAPPSRAYRVRKFMQRNRVAVGAGAAVAAALLAGVLGTSIGMVKADRQREVAVANERLAVAEAERANAAEQLAQKRAADIEQVAAFQERQFSGMDVPVAAERLRVDLSQRVRAAAERAKLEPAEVSRRVAEVEAITAGADFAGMTTLSLQQNVFEPALASISEQFADQPLVRARLQQSIAHTVRELGLLDLAEGPQDAALRTRREVLGPDHRDTLNSLAAKAALLRQQGKYAEAEGPFEEALAGLRKTAGDDDPDTLQCLKELGGLRQYQGRYDEAKACYTEAFERRKRVLGEDAPSTLIVEGDLGQLLLFQGKYDEAEALLKDAHERLLRVNGENNQATVNVVNSLGSLYVAMGRLDQAEVCYRRSLAWRRASLGENHPSTLGAMENLGGVLFRVGRLDEAVELVKAALAGRARLFGPDGAETLRSVQNLAFLERRQKKYEQAEAGYRRALAGFERLIGPDRPDTLIVRKNLGDVLRDQGKYDEAESVLRTALAAWDRGGPTNDPQSILTVFSLAAVFDAAGRYEDAARVMTDYEPAARRAYTGSQVRQLGDYLSQLGDCRTRAGQFAAAESALVEAHPLLVAGFGPAGDYTRRCESRLASLYAAWDAAEPGGGHGEKAAEWRARVDAAAAERK